MFQFPDWITIRTSAAFIQTTGRTPPAAIHSALERNIECGTINACLAARNYFHVRCGTFSRQSEQCPPVRPSKLTLVQVRVYDDARRWAQRSPASAQDRQCGLRD